ncbi:twitching motility protein PilT [Achromatium sp. WMS1]|nr:twitching motility protein PilT [Achromatium sp. WMS1]
MKLLLDTHAFIWLNHAPEKLSTTIREYCEQGTEQFFLSLVTPWEMQIKQQLGKLHIQPVVNQVIDVNIKENNITLLPITLAHIEQLNNLPMHHRDPFDRMLIAQAQVEKMTLVTIDKIFANYNIDIIW